MTTAHAPHTTAPGTPLVNEGIRGAVYSIAAYISAHDVVHAFRCAGITPPEQFSGITPADNQNHNPEKVFGVISGTVVDWTHPDMARRGLEALSLIAIRAYEDETHELNDSYFWTDWRLLQRACEKNGVLMERDGDMRLEVDETPAVPSIVLDTSGLGITSGIDDAVEDLNRLIVEGGSARELATVASTVVEAVGKTILRERGVQESEYARLYVHDVAARVHSELGLKEGEGQPGGAVVAYGGLVKALNRLVSGVRDTRNRAKKMHGSDTVTELPMEEGRLAVDGCVMWSRYVMDVYRRQKQEALPPF